MMMEPPVDDGRLLVGMRVPLLPHRPVLGGRGRWSPYVKWGPASSGLMRV